MSSPIPTLREYGEYLESLDQSLDIDALLVDERWRDLDELELVGTDAMVTALGKSPGPRTRRRRRLVVAAAAAAVLLVAGTVLVWGDGGRHVRTVPPAAPTPTTTPLDPSQSLDAVLPPEGAMPSTPETGELVAAITMSSDPTPAPRGEDAFVNLYADGRLISWRACRPSAGPCSLTASEALLEQFQGLIERRLTADGVERVRREFLATGLFNTDQAGAGIDVPCFCAIHVRDGGRLLSTGAMGAESTEEVKRQTDRLVAYVTTLDSSLPEGAWEDRTFRPYVPSHYKVCVWEKPGTPTADTNIQAVPHRSKVLAKRLPTPLVELLDEQAWVHTPSRDCVDLTVPLARKLAEGLTDAGVLAQRLGTPAHVPALYRISLLETDLHRLGTDPARGPASAHASRLTATTRASAAAVKAGARRLRSRNEDSFVLARASASRRRESLGTWPSQIPQCG